MAGYFDKQSAPCGSKVPVAAKAAWGAKALAALVIAAGLTGPAMARDKHSVEIDGESTQTPLQMLISLSDQKINVFRGVDLISTSPISSGRRGHSTPTGVFSILEKRRRHFSNLYNNAPMPFMQRLTWSGIALHQGRLPGYPASHGCIRLPRAFAKDLFGMTDRGMHVVVTREEAKPEIIRHDVLPQPLSRNTEVASLSGAAVVSDVALRGSIPAETVMAAALADPKAVRAEENPNFDQPLRMIVTPRKAENEVRTLQRLLNEMGFNAGPVDGVAGRKTRAAVRLFQEGADLPMTGQITDGFIQNVYLAAGYEKPQNATLRIRRKFKDVYSAPVTLKDVQEPIGTHVFTALAFEQGAGKVDWMAVAAEGSGDGTPHQALDRLKMSEKVQADLRKMLTPGTSLIITDRSFARNTGLGTDFVVVTR